MLPWKQDLGRNPGKQMGASQSVTALQLVFESSVTLPRGFTNCDNTSTLAVGVRQCSPGRWFLWTSLIWSPGRRVLKGVGSCPHQILIPQVMQANHVTWLFTLTIQNECQQLLCWWTVIIMQMEIVEACSSSAWSETASLKCFNYLRSVYSWSENIKNTSNVK